MEVNKGGEIFMLVKKKIKKERILVNLNECLKEGNIDQDFKEKYDLFHVASSTINKGYLFGEKIERIIFYLRSRGCEWNRTYHGGCFMCGHYHGTIKGMFLPKGAFYQQFIQEYAKYNFEKYPMLCIYNAGSLLNENEVPRDELYKIFKTINANLHIKRLIIESRPEFVDSEVLVMIQQLLKNITVEIGIGLETANDTIRDYCVNKGFAFSDYIKVASKIKKFSNIKLLTYLTIKPLFLTIEESIDDVIKSIYAIRNYTDVISLEPLSIQKNTLVELLYLHNLYEPPKGWIVKEIFKRKNFFIDEMRIGGFEFFPIPKLFINNCELCNEDLYDAIEYYNTNKDISKIMELNCTCYHEFIEKVQIENMQKNKLQERISQVLMTLKTTLTQQREKKCFTI